jgi:hypothetical protein
VRLFRKLTSLRILIIALTTSIIPVMYAFMILLLISTMYAVVATDLFRCEEEGGGGGRRRREEEKD